MRLIQAAICGLFGGGGLLSRLPGVCFDPNTGANGGANGAGTAAGTVAAPVQQSAPAGGQQASAPNAGGDGGMTAAIGAAIAAHLAPVVQTITQGQTALENRLNQALNPTQQAGSVLFGAPGAAPAIRQGENIMSSRGYSFQRVARLAQDPGAREQAKIEIDMSNRLRQAYARTTGFEAQQANSVLVPIGADYLFDEFGDGFRSEVRQSMFAGAMGCDVSEAQWLSRRQGVPAAIRQSLSQFDETGLGVLLGNTTQGEFIELLRNTEAFSRLGATNVPLPPNGRILFPRQTGAMTAYFMGENNQSVTATNITASEPTTGSVEMRARKLACLVKMPNELLKFGSPMVEALIRNDMAQVMALKADRAMIDGAASTTGIKGLLNYSGINSYTATTVGSNGNTLEPQDLGLFMSTIEQANLDLDMGAKFRWLLRSELFWKILNKRTVTYSGSGEVGEFVWGGSRETLAAPVASALLGYQAVRSNQVPRDRVKGSGTDLTPLIGGRFDHWLIGRVGVMEVLVANQGDTMVVADQTWMRAIQYIDAVPRYQEAFTVCDYLVRT